MSCKSVRNGKATVERKDKRVLRNLETFYKGTRWVVFLAIRGEERQGYRH